MANSCYRNWTKNDAVPEVRRDNFGGYATFQPGHNRGETSENCLAQDGGRYAYWPVACWGTVESI